MLWKDSGPATTAVAPVKCGVDYSRTPQAAGLDVNEMAKMSHKPDSSESVLDKRTIGGGWFPLVLAALAVAGAYLVPACASYEPWTPMGKRAKALLQSCEADPDCREDAVAKGIRAARIARVLICAEAGGTTCAALSAAALIQRARLAQQRVQSAANEVDAADREIAAALRGLTAAEVNATAAVVADDA